MTEQQEQSMTNEKLHWSFWFGVGFFVIVIITILSIAVFLNKRMSAEEASPITSITIDGEMPYTQQIDIEKVMKQIDLGNFFNLNVNLVQQKISALPWVYRVSVRKVWPDELKVYIIDQKPVAFWNSNFFINEQGVAFQADASRVVSSLPSFFGPEGSEHLALAKYHDFSKLLAFSQLNIDEMVLTERFAWQITLDDGVTLKLGRDKPVERIERFMDSYPQIKLHRKADQDVNYIDLRYDTGLAVGWKVKPIKTRV